MNEEKRALLDVMGSCWKFFRDIKDSEVWSHQFGLGGLVRNMLIHAPQAITLNILREIAGSIAHRHNQFGEPSELDLGTLRALEALARSGPKIT